MRFTIIREELLKLLNLVSRPIPIKTFIPALAYMKINLDDTGLTLTGSNETLAIQSFLPIKREDKEIIRNFRPGSILVQGKTFTEIIKKLSSYEITFEVLDNNIIEITNDKSSFQLNSANIDEYPPADFSENGMKFNLKKDDLVSLIEQTSFAAATKENRVMLTSVNLKGENHKLTACALDALRLSQKEIPIEEDLNFNINISAKVLDEIVKMFEDVNNVTVIINDAKVLFKFGTSIVSSSLVKGDFPNTKNFVPKSINISLVVNTNEMMSAIDRVLLLSNEKNAIRLTLNSNEVIISSLSSEIGNASERINDFEYNNETFNIYCNGLHLLDCLRAIRAETALFEFVCDTKPFVIKKVNSDEIIELLVPVRI